LSKWQGRLLWIDGKVELGYSGKSQRVEQKQKKSEIKKEKQHLKEKREKLEVIAESRDLSKQEWAL
jgi:hypothetical protein